MAADKVAALHSAGPAIVGVADDGGGAVVVGAAEDVVGLAEEVPGPVLLPWGCGWVGPQAVSSSAAAAAAVVINPCDKN